MTKRERAIKERAWLKIKVFCITSSLQRKMAADTTLTEEQKEWLAYIQSKVVTESRRNPALWVNIGTKYFKDRIRGNYKRWILYLKGIGELDVNNPYKAAGGDGWPMSYCIPKVALDSGVVKISFKRIKIQPPRAKPAQPSGDVVLEYAATNLKRLTVAERLLSGPDAIHDVLIHQFCWMAFHGFFGLRRGANCRRLYHGVIEMPKEGRANLQLADSSEQLFEYDVKSCHPVLLLNLFTDPTERQRYSQLLDADVYLGIAAAMQKALTRDEVKEHFLEAVNRSDRALRVLEQKWVYQCFRRHFPIFTEQVLNVRTDLALFLQNEEARLMVDELGKWCQANRYLWIPCHDGWMGTAEHEPEIVAKVHDLFATVTGYAVTVSKVELISRKAVCLFTHPLSGSYVGVNDTSQPSPALEKVGGEVGGLEEIVAPVRPRNPWKEMVDCWQQQNDPVLLQEAAMKRAEARNRRKEGAKLAEANKEASKRLAKQVAEAMKKLGG